MAVMNDISRSLLHAPVSTFLEEINKFYLVYAVKYDSFSEKTH